MGRLKQDVKRVKYVRRYVPGRLYQKTAYTQTSLALSDNIAQKIKAYTMDRDRTKVREILRTLEDVEPVGIVEFIESDEYLNLGDYIYPAGKWMLKTFYEPWNCWEDYDIVWRGKRYVFPGFGSMGYTKEETDSLYFNQMVGLIGQRFGKSVISAICVLYELYKLLCEVEPTSVVDGIAPGTLIALSVSATAQKQAQGTVWAYVEEFRDNSPWFQKYIDACSKYFIGGDPAYSDTQLDFIFRHKNIVVNATHSKSSSLRGATRACVVMDEIAHFDDGMKHNADSVADAMLNSLITFKDYAKAIVISSPLHIADKACRMYAECGVQFESEYYSDNGWEPLKEINGVPVQLNNKRIGFHFPTWDVNPFQAKSDFEVMFATNPESTQRDFGAMPSQALEAFFSNPSKIDEIFDGRLCPIDSEGRIDTKLLKPKPGIDTYHLHVDVGSGKPSNFGIVLAHVEKSSPEPDVVKYTTYVDLAYAVKADANGEMDFEKAREILDYIISRFPGIIYSSDRWNDLEYRQKIRKKCKVLSVVLSKEEYDELKNQVYTNCVQCHEMPLLKTELKRLETINGIKVEKGSGCTKDVADCLAAVTARITERVLKQRAVGRSTQGMLQRV